jgi:ribosomal protein S18 acetylase RimI-like enzyme
MIKHVSMSGEFRRVALEGHLIIRPLDLSDDSNEIEQLNALLKEAYGALAESGPAFAASCEGVSATRRRVQEGQCFLAILDEVPVGCVILRVTSTARGPEWYKASGVASIGRLAVRPALQNRGIGKKLLHHAEESARASNCTELAMDTSEQADQLIRMYERWGYVQVSYHQWPGTSFRSVVLSKKL